MSVILVDAECRLSVLDKARLRSQSPFFDRLFKDNERETIFSFPQVESTFMCSLARYLLCPRAYQPEETRTIDLLNVAKDFELNPLVVFLEATTELTTQNVLKTLALSKARGYDHLRERCLAFIKGHPVEMATGGSRRWKSLHASEPELANEIFLAYLERTSGPG